MILQLVEVLDDPTITESNQLFFAKTKLSQAQSGLIEALTDWCRR